MSNSTPVADTISDEDSNNLDGEQSVAEIVRNFDWASTPLGPMDSWPRWLKILTDLCLNAVFPMVLFIGHDRIFIYNQMWIQIIQANHPCIGTSATHTYSELRDVLVPIFELTLKGQGQYSEDCCMPLIRSGYKEEAYFSYSHSPLYTDTGEIGGTVAFAHETTKSNQNDDGVAKRARLEATTFDNDLVCVKKADGTEEYMYIHGQSSRDIPDDLLKTPDVIVMPDSEGDIVHLDSYSTNAVPWPVERAMCSSGNVIIQLPDESRTLLCPVTSISGGKDVLTAVMICGINKHRALDKDYEEFFQLIVKHVSFVFTNAVLRKEEQRQRNMLAELDRQKIAFFENISHSLRSPLTLMLSPLEEGIELCPKKSPVLNYLKLIQNNYRRLLSLINSLLQFAHIEAGRIHACFCATNIAKLTVELAASFESMAKALGLYYKLDIPSDEELCQINQKMFLDQDMYEKILFNLCSNAFNYTQTGGVTVRLLVERNGNKEGVVLEVSDTGVGIADNHLSNIFQRFYRVESQQSRSHYEGTGIGLALVKEFVTRHGGEISVKSQLNVGSTFRVWLPSGSDHLPRKQVYLKSKRDESKLNAEYREQINLNINLYLYECMQRVRESESSSPQTSEGDYQHSPMQIDYESLSFTSSPRADERSALRMKPSDVEFEATRKYILVVDDNADMRNYLNTLIEKQFACICAADGYEALKIVRNSQRLPDLILSDVMMPNMDGFELLKALRGNPATQAIPVILLSARSGEASIEGLEKGADDYIIKPFNARELMARIHVNLKLSHVRRQLMAEQQHQLEIKQLLFTISNKIHSGFGIQETLDTAVSEIKKVLICDSLLIIQDISENESIGGKVMAASLSPMDNSIEIVGRIFHEEQQQTETTTDFSPATNPRLLLHHCDGHIEPDSLLSDITSCSDCESKVLNQRVSFLSAAIYLKSSPWGWIIAYRQPYHKWTESETNFLHQVSNQISLAISHAILVEKKLKQEAQVKAIEETNRTKGQILAGTSHELRNLLGTITGALSAFEGTQLTAEQQDMVEVMSRASDVVMSVVNDILDTAKLDAQKLTLINRVFDLWALVEKTVTTFGERVGAKELELIVLYDPETLSRYVKTDPERLQQVIMNLLSNAIKFTDNGEIVIKLSIRNGEDMMVDDNPDSNKLLCVEVSDTGVGIDPASIKHIWENFSQGDASMTRGRDGTGLGLSLCKSLVELNGGKIGVDSKIGIGSKFWFTWIIEDTSLSSIPKLPSRDDRSNLQGQPNHARNVLIIDPVETARSAYATLIKGSVEKVYTYADCTRALEAAKKHKKDGEHMCDLAFLSVRNNDAVEIENAAKELKRIYGNGLSIVLMVFWSVEGHKVGKSMIEKLGTNVAAICKPVTHKCIMDCVSDFDMFLVKPKDADSKEMERTSLSTYSKFYNHNRPAVYRSGKRDIKEQVIVRGVMPSSKDESKSKSKIVGTQLVPMKRSAYSELKDQSGSEERARTSRSRVSKCILCVDDNAINLKIVKTQLDKLGYTYLTAANGKEAVDLIRTQYENSQTSSMDSSQSLEFKLGISLILMDCAMPVMSGFEATRAIRSINPEFQTLPIVALTACAIAEIREQCLEAGMNDYLTKPLRIKQLKEKLNEWLGEN
ncbi:6752_t:CDS:10 [Paraglomus occultum]|uniref:histidine kinase n=1 Tax=Paraglomus occultum TaxID=144539 RepID=A0A9N9FL31_9GLOM|nr:6752_t:CDS:10 [Paraglomus occultum]